MYCLAQRQQLEQHAAAAGLSQQTQQLTTEINLAALKRRKLSAKQKTSIASYWPKRFIGGTYIPQSQLSSRPFSSRCLDQPLVLPALAYD